MFTLPERMILADEEWLPVLQGKWVSKPDYTLMVTDNVMQGQFGRFMPYGPGKVPCRLLRLQQHRYNPHTGACKGI